MRVAEAVRPTSLAELDVPAVTGDRDSPMMLASIREHNRAIRRVDDRSG